MSSELNNSKLLDFLEELDKELDGKIIVVAVGGTAMTLLGIKPSYTLTFKIKGLEQN